MCRKICENVLMYIDVTTNTNEDVDSPSIIQMTIRIAAYKLIIKHSHVEKNIHKSKSGKDLDTIVEGITDIHSPILV